MISHFTEEGTQTAHKYIQTCSTPLVIRKTASLIQTQVWLHAHHFHKNWRGVAEWQKLSPAEPAVGDDQEKPKLICCRRHCTLFSYMNMVFPNRDKHKYTISHSLLEYSLEEPWHECTRTDVQTRSAYCCL